MTIKKPKSYRCWAGIEPHSIDLVPHTIEVLGENRRLRILWIPELAEDLEQYHNIDAEAELIALLTAELDQRIIEQFINMSQSYYAISETMGLVYPKKYELPNKQQNYD